MNKEEYLEKKKKRLLEKEQNRKICLTCLRAHSNCFCDIIKPFNTKTRFTILMHPKEARKQRIGTGRLSHLALKNSQIIIGEEFNDNKELINIINNPNIHNVLLYPGIKSTPIDQKKYHIPTSKLFNILVLDGTWPMAKSMMRRSSILHDLPRISFQNIPESIFDIKQQPAKYCISTIEALYYTIEFLKNWQQEECEEANINLINILKHLVAFQKKCASDPNRVGYRRGKGYKKPEQRKKTIYSRPIFFLDSN